MHDSIESDNYIENIAHKMVHLIIKMPIGVAHELYKKHANSEYSEIREYAELLNKIMENEFHDTWKQLINITVDVKNNIVHSITSDKEPAEYQWGC